MPNDLALSALSTIPSVISPALLRTLDVTANKLTAVGFGHEIASTDAPSDETRDDFSRRVAALDHWLRPAPPEALLDEVTKIMLLPARAGSTDDAKTLIRIYAADLADIPLFALIRACADFRQGRAGDGWRPTQAEIRQRSLVHSTPARQERRKLLNVLEAKIVHVNVSAERRAAVAEMARQAAREIGEAGRAAEAARLGRAVEGQAPKVETPDELVARLRAESTRPIAPLSEAAKRRFVPDERESAA